MKLYNLTLHFSIFFFTAALGWFAFVYYPRVITDYRTGDFPKKAFVPSAVASHQFPIETDFFKLIYEEGSGAYYAVINGATLDDYLISRDSAKLALKTALSVESLCDLNVIYISQDQLSIPERFVDDGC